MERSGAFSGSSLEGGEHEAADAAAEGAAAEPPAAEALVGGLDAWTPISPSTAAQKAASRSAGDGRPWSMRGTCSRLDLTYDVCGEAAHTSWHRMPTPASPFGSACSFATTSTPLGRRQRRWVHDYLRMPMPPNLGLSVQLMH